MQCLPRQGGDLCCCAPNASVPHNVLQTLVPRHNAQMQVAQCRGKCRATQCTPGRILLRARWLLLQHTLLSFSQFILLFKILLFPKPSPRVPLESTPSCFYPTPHSCTHPTLIPVSSYLQTIPLQPTPLPFSFFHRTLFLTSSISPLLQYPSPPNSTTRWFVYGGRRAGETIADSLCSLPHPHPLLPTITAYTLHCKASKSQRCSVVRTISLSYERSLLCS